MKSPEPGINYLMHQYKLEPDQLESSLAENALVVLVHTKFIINWQCMLVAKSVISWGTLGKALPEG